jgi:hypothetical protein
VQVRRSLDAGQHLHKSNSLLGRVYQSHGQDGDRQNLQDKNSMKAKKFLTYLRDSYEKLQKDKASIRQEVEPAIATVTQRSEKTTLTIQEIRQALREYASECSTTQCLSTGDKAEEGIVDRKKASTGAIRAGW